MGSAKWSVERLLGPVGGKRKRNVIDGDGIPKLRNDVRSGSHPIPRLGARRRPLKLRNNVNSLGIRVATGAQQIPSCEQGVLVGPVIKSARQTRLLFTLGYPRLLFNYYFHRKNKQAKITTPLCALILRRSRSQPSPQRDSCAIAQGLSQGEGDRSEARASRPPSPRAAFSLLFLFTRGMLAPNSRSMSARFARGAHRRADHDSRELHCMQRMPESRQKSGERLTQRERREKGKNNFIC